MKFRGTGLAAMIAGVIGVGGIIGASGMGRVLAAGGPDSNTTCTSTSACASYANNGSGPGVASSSAGGSGLTGSTTHVGTSTGVLGTDASASGSTDSGVNGVSKLGTGVLGTSKNGTGVKGTSTKGEGVKGTSAAGNALAGVDGISTSSTGIGVIGSSPFIGMEATGLVGLLAAESGTSPGTALQVNSDSSGGDLVLGRSGFNTVFSIDELGNFTTGGSVTTNSVTASNNMTANSGLFNLLDANSSATDVAFGAYENSADGYAAIQAESTVASGAYLYDGFDYNLNAVYSVDSFGNIRIAGLIYTAGGCNSGCMKTGPGARRVVSYAPRESQPTMEDFGSGQLARGRAHIALGSDFSNVIDHGSTYMVFLTPDGDCNGLYVADKAPQGFDVGELRGGTSNIAFDYRIVAKPYGDHSARLPMVNLENARPARVPRHTHR